MSNPLVELGKFGQSVWFDNISRKMLKENELKNLVESGEVKGVTSNPAIFEKAIGSGNDYDEQIKNYLLKFPSSSPKEIFEEVAVKDIQDACDILRKVYDETNGVDGYVSIEVSPDLAYKTNETIEEARKLNKAVNRPNVMIKIPATQEGMPAIKQMISEGVNINVTLIFGQKEYEQVVEAYISGLEEREKNGGKIDNISSVASFFISRIDSAVDKALEEKNNKILQGKIAIANAKIVYEKSEELFGSERFNNLKAKGARIQRLLWASTSTKNPSYPATIYVDELIGADTVNTMPPATVEAFRKDGTVAETIHKNIDGAKKEMAELASVGINFKEITDKLTTDGVTLFADAFVTLLNAIKEKKEKLLNELSGKQTFYINNELRDSVRNRLSKWKEEKTIERVWKKDPTVWKEKKEDDVELSNRLGWLNLANEMQSAVNDLNSFAEEIKKEFNNIILLGMGGSSLAPEVFFKVFGAKEGYPNLSVLDSTHPMSVRNVLEAYDAKKTLYIVSSKSGGTAETMSFFYIMFDAVSKVKKNAGENFVAITDSGSGLEKLAKEKNFRRIFNTQSNVGGRYSALTFFGLVPAALIGIDVNNLLQNAAVITSACSPETSLENNPGFLLGALMGECSLAGKNKLTIFSSPKIFSFTSWVEQLIAESTGKEEKGILPVADEFPGDISDYGIDRLFVYLRLKDDNNVLTDKKVEELGNAGEPGILIELENNYDLGKEFFRWEIATAMAGAVLNINPFDQPNVQLAKTLANESLDEYRKTGTLPNEKPSLNENGISYYGETFAGSINEAVEEFLHHVNKNDYISLMAFVQPEESVDKVLKEVSVLLRNKFKAAVTFGYGPRFLHSTGQLHKGDGNQGVFIQFTSDVEKDIEVPGQGYSFGTLITAQAQGDLKALKNTKRRVIRIHFEGNVAEGIKNLFL